jgi:hypothetical protein
MTLVRLSAAAAVALLAASAASAQPAGGGRLMACKDDVAKLCQGVERGGGRIAQCLKAHSQQVSSGCKSAIAETMAERRQDQANTPPPAAPKGQ